MDKIIQEFDAFFATYGQRYSEFYVGIASNPKEALVYRHNASTWIHSPGLITSAKARAIEKYFLSKGAKGGPGGGDLNTRYVYAYKITSSTHEDK